MAAAPHVEVENLSKHYRVHKRASGIGAALRSLFRRDYEERRAVIDLSFRIAAGERVGFLGPNGAGKTTTLKMLAGLLYPTGGSLRVAGHVPQRREPDFLRQITLVMGQKQQLLWDLPPADTFELNRAVYDVPRAQFRETLDELVKLLDIGEVSRTPTRQLSLGERMKCELAAALLHRPKLLFLDEPTIGLDVSMQVVLRQFIRAYNERFQATVLLTSHYMEDVLKLCPRVLVIDAGRLRYDGDLPHLVRSLRPEKRIAMRREGGDLDAGSLEKLRRMGTLLSHEGGQVVLQVPQSELRSVVAGLIEGFSVADMTIEDPPLEEVLRELFAKAKGRSEAAITAEKSRSATEPT
jgi:ABC-2 type transport system ATP-binding protein